MKNILTVLFLIAVVSAFGNPVSVTLVPGGGASVGGNSTNSLLHGPGGQYDASLVTNVPGNKISSPLNVNSAIFSTMSVTNQITDINGLKAYLPNLRELFGLDGLYPTVDAGKGDLNTPGGYNTLDWANCLLVSTNGNSFVPNLDWHIPGQITATNITAGNVTGLVMKANSFVGPLTGNSATATSASYGGGIVTNLPISSDAFTKVSTTFTAPMCSLDWAPFDAGFDPFSIQGAGTYVGIWRYTNNCWVVGENNTPAVSVSMHSLPIPIGVTSVTLTMQAKSLSGNIQPYFGFYNHAGFMNYTNFVIQAGTSWTNISVTQTIQAQGSPPTNFQAVVYLNGPNAGMMVTNLQVTYLPASAVVAAGIPASFWRYNVSPDEVQNNASAVPNYSNIFGYNYQRFTSRGSSSGSYVDFTVSGVATNVVIEIGLNPVATSFETNTIFVDYGTPQGYMTNISLTSPSGGPSEQLQFVNLPLPSQAVNNVRVYNSYAGNGYADFFMRAVYVPQGVQVSFVPTTTPQLKIMIVGDSIPVGPFATTVYSTPANLIKQVLGGNIYNTACAGMTVSSLTNLNSLGLLAREISAVNPSVIWMELGVNDININSMTTNQFVGYAGTVCNVMHKAAPNAVIYYQTPILSVNIPTYATNNAAIANICNSRSNYMCYVDASAWLNSGDLQDGTHPTEAGNAKLIYHVITNLVNNVGGVWTTNLP